MADDMSDIAAAEAAPQWPLRPWLLAGLLGLAGLLIHLLTHEREDVPWQVAAAAFVFFGAFTAAFTVEQRRWKEPAAFALVIGLVMAGLAWRAVRYGDHLPDEQYGFAAGVVASALALPLFQAGFLRTRFRTSYAAIYHDIWNDAISAAGALAFTGLSWVALAVVSQLFQLLKIDVLKDLMNQGWFGWTFSALAFGAALGVLRNELKVLGMLRTVVLLVLSLLAVPLAIGLVVFLLATAVSGPSVLWEATREATPTLLACAAGAFGLTCVLVRQDDATMTRSRVMRGAALALAIVILPLALFAAVSLGLRLNQYGLAPEGLWGLVTVVVACAWGVGFWGALIRGRKAGWAQKLREANVILAVASCLLALFLALPILDFGAISAANQLHRLESGKVSLKKFDYAALRWDFGGAGRRALAQLTKSPNAKIAELAALAEKQPDRPYAYGGDTTFRTEAQIDVRVQPEDPALRKLVIDYLQTHRAVCAQFCVALDLGKGKDGGRDIALVDQSSYQRVSLPADTRELVGNERYDVPPKFGPASKVEIRNVEQRYIFVDGRSVGQPLD